MLLSFQSGIQIFENFSIVNIIGFGVQWIFLYSNDILFYNMSMKMVRVDATSIVELLSSKMNILNSEMAYFYPEFIYSSLSNLVVDNCFFHDSYYQDKTKNFQIIAIFIENFNSFIISNTRFDSITNEINGPVNFEKYKIKIVYFFKKGYHS